MAEQKKNNPPQRVHANEPAISQGTYAALIQRLEWGAALTLTALALALHFIFFLKAGALWRDEASGLEVALLPTMGDVWRHGEFDSFPQGWHWVLRMWSAAGLGASDWGWRGLGLIVGMGILWAFWRNARQFGPTAPLLGLVLLEFNAVVILYGDSIRGLGLGSALGLFTMGAVWKLARSPGPGSSLRALILALLSVHVLFQNSAFLLAASIGGMVISLRQGRWRTVVLIAAIGLVCAASLLIYAPTISRAAEWNMILKYPVDLAWIWKMFGFATAWMGVSKWLWVGAWILGTAGLICALWPAIYSSLDEKQRAATLFCGTILTVGVPCQILFLKVLSYGMSPWYFIVTLILVAGCLEGSLAVFERWIAWRVIRLAAAAGLGLVLFWPAYESAGMRMTNMDQIAQVLNRESRPGDLLIINPWYYGTSLQRYYRGKADWMTVPPMADHKLHRYDLLKGHMLRTDSMKPLIEKLTECLKAGKRVWVVGDIQVPPNGQNPPEVPVAPTSEYGWHEGLYYQIWALQIGKVLSSHALTAKNLHIAEGQSINGYENPPLYVLEGWFEGTP